MSWGLWNRRPQCWVLLSAIPIILKFIILILNCLLLVTSSPYLFFDKTLSFTDTEMQSQHTHLCKKKPKDYVIHTIFQSDRGSVIPQKIFDYHISICLHMWNTKLSTIEEEFKPNVETESSLLFSNISKMCRKFFSAGQKCQEDPEFFCFVSK